MIPRQISVVLQRHKQGAADARVRTGRRRNGMANALGFPGNSNDVEGGLAKAGPVPRTARCSGAIPGQGADRGLRAGLDDEFVS